MKTRTTTIGGAVVAGLLAAAMPSLARAVPGDAHDDATYPSYANAGAAIAGPAAGPKALARDDAPYPAVAADDQPQAGIAVAITDGPEPYAHDDATYAAPSTPAAPEPQPAERVAARSAGR